MVDLPLEIIQNIITVSLPQSSYQNQDRQKFLLPLCHVHSSLRQFAQRLLFSHVTLRTVDQFGRFLDTVGAESKSCDFGGYVRALQLGGEELKAVDDDFDSLVARMVDSCKEIETITLYDTNGINFAHFFGLSKLRGISCRSVEFSTSEPARELKPLASLTNLTFVRGWMDILLDDGFLTHVNIPSLRLLCVDTVPADDILDDVTLANPSTLYATHLHHLNLTGSYAELFPLLRATRQLRSLQCDSSALVSIPVDHRFGTALVAIRMQLTRDSEPVMTALESALESGLIDGQTVVFCTRRWGNGIRSPELGEWCRARGMRVEWWDGELELSWWDGSLVDNGHRHFASWVDKRAEARIAAIQE